MGKPSRKGIGGPKTPEGRARALMNLRPFWPKEGPDVPGVGGITLLQPQTRLLAEQLKAILEGDAATYVRPADEVALGLLAVVLRRVQQCERYLDRVGTLTTARGATRPAAELLLRLIREGRELCNSLGLTPQARARLGLNVARASTDLATLLAEEEEADGDRQSGG